MNFLPVKLQERSCIFRVIADDVTGNVVSDVFDELITRSREARGNGRHESQTHKGGFPAPHSRRASPPREPRGC